MAVSSVFNSEGIETEHIGLGEVELKKPLSSSQLEKINGRLTTMGFEILDDGRQKQIGGIKKLLIEKVQTADIEEHFSLSKFLQQQLNKEYSQLSRLFSSVEGITIEQFFILQKTEKVKEWLTYDELTLSEIAWKLGYSSVAHLSAQFKKTTGMTPSQFKKIGSSNRRPLDHV
jgi:AraC-like DNA-binding protein